jgi:hypothetical protein
MTPATTSSTRKYKEKGGHLGHGEIREEQHSTRTWKKDKGAPGENARNATDEERGTRVGRRGNSRRSNVGKMEGQIDPSKRK